MFSDKLGDDGVAAARVDVTLKFLEAELNPSSVASTVCGPGVEMGTVKLAKNTPLGVVVTVAGVVVIGAPSNVTSTAEIGSNPAPTNIYRRPDFRLY